MSTERFIRRNRVDEPIAVAGAAVFGLAAVFSGARPTGSILVDIVFVFVAVTAVVWASASAQWWASAGASGVGAVIAFHPIVSAIGALGFLGGLNIGTWRREQTNARLVVGGVAINVLIRSDLGGFVGLSALIGFATSIALFVLGCLRRPSAVRRTAWMSVAAVGGLFVLAGLAVVTAVVGARPSLRDGAQTARQAVDALNAGDYQTASALFDQASIAFQQADDRLGGVVASPRALIPGVGQNVSAAADLSAAAADATAEAAGALRQVDPSELRVTGGAIDLEAVRAVEKPLQRVDSALAGLRSAVDDIDSPWLLGAVKDELLELDDDFARNEPRLQNAIDAVRLAPQMLGEESTRRYLMLFTTPSEARGVGGFVGSFAVLEIEGGRMKVTRFGRTHELSDASAGTDCSECPPELLSRYGPFGWTTGTGGTVGSVLWSNITMPAHFPYIAETAWRLFPQGHGGQQIDGVIVLDPHVVQALMQYSGPVPVPELDVVVQPDDAANFILAEQYVLAEQDALADSNGVRVEALNTLATGAIRAILTGSLPEPPTIARDLGPLIAERRLLMWTDVEEERLLLDRVGLLGTLPPIDPIDGGFSVSITNGSANKIDVYLDRTTEVKIEDTERGRILTADVTLRNESPSAGLPEVVIGNLVGLPDGWSRLFVTFYGPPTLLTSTLDGVEFPVRALPEAGWMAFSTYVDLAPGQTRTFRLVFSLPPSAGEHDGASASPTVWEQPLAERTTPG